MNKISGASTTLLYNQLFDLYEHFELFDLKFIMCRNDVERSVWLAEGTTCHSGLFAQGSEPAVAI
jgi:hypothetical protein